VIAGPPASPSGSVPNRPWVPTTSKASDAKHAAA
jgi:hypothetical protein